MAQQVVFSCPSCGASLSVEAGASFTQCQFCGSTVAVPNALRSQAAPNNPSYALPGSSVGADRTKLTAIGNAVRAGNNAEAVRLYQEQFSVGQAAAQQAVNQLAAGQSVVVGTLPNGMPEYLQVPSMAPATPYYVPVMNQAYANRNTVFRGVMGFNIALTLAIFGFTACIFVFVFLAVGLAFMPGLFSGLGPLFGR